MIGNAGTVWGFGDTPALEGAFRFVQSSGAFDIPFGTAHPSIILNQHLDTVPFASTDTCTLEVLELETASSQVRSSISCFAEIASVELDAGLGSWVRVIEGGTTSIGMIDGLEVQAPSYARSNMADAVGPFVSPDTFQAPYWFAENHDAGATVYQGRTAEWPVPPPTEVDTVDTRIDVGTLVEGRFWGAVTGTAPHLFPVDGSGLPVWYPITYHPVRMLGLYDRLAILLADGTLLEQMLPSP